MQYRYCIDKQTELTVYNTLKTLYNNNVVQPYAYIVLIIVSLELCTKKTTNPILFAISYLYFM